MAPGLIVNPPESPSPSLLVEPPEQAEGEEAGDDLTRPLSRGSSSWNDIDGLLPPSSTSSRNSASLLTPDIRRTLRRPANIMASEAPIAEGASAGPFNFQTQLMSTSPVKSNIGQRRGHRYKHSSISAQHQIFQEPPQRPPSVLPASLPIPTLKEAWSSMYRDQRARLYWCICHCVVAAYVFFSAGGSLAMTGLSHLVFFDVGSAAICVGVDVLGNFEVWRRSSIRHPFGLQRAEVLAGFAMSIFLVFGGFDLLSHNLKHVLESVGSHAPHHPYEHVHTGDGQSGNDLHLGHGDIGHTVSPGTVDTASLAAVASTLISAYGLKNHARISRVMRVAYPSYLSTLLPDILANPFHFLTLFFSFLLLLLPLLSVAFFAWLDRLICAAIAVSMFILGTRLAIAQGFMLLMSYNGRKAPASGVSTFAAPEKLKKAGMNGTRERSGSSSGVSDVVHEIESETAVSRVDEAQFWQVHYGLCMANLKVCVIRGCDDSALSLLRARVGRIIQNRLGEGYGKGNALRWEVTIQTSSDSSPPTILS